VQGGGRGTFKGEGKRFERQAHSKKRDRKFQYPQGGARVGPVGGGGGGVRGRNTSSFNASEQAKEGKNIRKFITVKDIQDRGRFSETEQYRTQTGIEKREVSKNWLYLRPDDEEYNVSTRT